MEGQDPRVLLCEMYGTVSFQRFVSTLQIMSFVHRFTHLVHHQCHSSSPPHRVLPSLESCSSVGSCIVVLDLHVFVTRRHTYSLRQVATSSFSSFSLLLCVSALSLHFRHVSASPQPLHFSPARRGRRT